MANSEACWLFVKVEKATGQISKKKMVRGKVSYSVHKAGTFSKILQVSTSSEVSAEEAQKGIDYTVHCGQRELSKWCY